MNVEKSVLAQLLGQNTAPETFSFGAWREVHEWCREAYSKPIDVAIASAAAGDRLAWVFGSGYSEAVRALVGSARAPDGLASLCVTEMGGNGPKAIEASYDADAGTLTGTKTMVSGGPWAEWFVVLASRGESADGRKELSLLAVPSGRDGVSVEELDALPIVPEMPHAIVRFDQVQVAREEVLSNNAWQEYVRPFRVVEDLYVYAALVAWMTGLARESGQLDLVHRFMALVAAARNLAGESPHEDATVSALAGLRAIGKETIEAFDWSKVDDEVREMWERDKGLLGVASKARARRLRLVQDKLMARNSSAIGRA